MKTHPNYSVRFFLTILLFISFTMAFPYRPQECKPVASFGSYKGVCSIPAAEFKAIKFLTCTCDESAKYEIVSFELTATSSGQTKIAVCLGNAFSKEAKAILVGVKIGSKIFIDNVKVKDSSGNTKIIPGLTITVKA